MSNRKPLKPVRTHGVPQIGDFVVLQDGRGCIVIEHNTPGTWVGRLGNGATVSFMRHDIESITEA